MINYESRMEKLLNEYNRLSACNAIQNFKLSDMLLYDTNVVKSKGLDEPSIVKHCVGKVNLPLLKIKGNVERYRRGAHVAFSFTRPKEEIQQMINNNDPGLMDKVMRKLTDHGEKYFGCSIDRF
jgi:hypothetical protein